MMRLVSGAFLVIAFILLLYGTHRAVAAFFLFLMIIWHGVELAMGGGDPRNKQ